ncbi:MAG: helix-turn-helix domain-containing protein [Candidatus Omnitrophica bacterium]|nr:helix-turn-helix domain-containing protein [Candidatus Omnitrophota bacterium]MCF7895276.1 helix-turn-helix domain-containing protein [Candidatus Omnitrophota bacterium]
MKKEYSKYFWNLNKQALEKVEAIFKNPEHPKFNMYMAIFLSRCQKPKELFSLIEKESFINFWPKLKRYWHKVSPKSTFIDWWQTIYEQLLENKGLSVKKTSGVAPSVLIKIGKTLRKARIDKGLSQKDLALQVGMKQPDISKIEEGKTNVTLLTLSAICKALKTKKIEF